MRDEFDRLTARRKVLPEQVAHLYARCEELAAQQAAASD